jgi:hypothetical protein
VPLELPPLNFDDAARVLGLYAAISIGYADSAPHGRQFHVGILYRSDDGVKQLDLMWHHIMRSSTQPNHHGWLTVALDEETRELLAAKCRDLWNVYGLPEGADGINFNSTIPYGLEFNTEFLDGYRLSAVGPGTGFTCATFVMAALALVGVRLFNMDTWQRRAGDDAWQDWIINELSRGLENNRITQAEIDGLIASRGTLRFRATDVAAAVATGGWPLPFAEADALRIRLEAEAGRLLPPQPMPA